MFCSAWKHVREHLVQISHRRPWLGRNLGNVKYACELWLYEMWDDWRRGVGQKVFVLQEAGGQRANRKRFQLNSNRPDGRSEWNARVAFMKHQRENPLGSPPPLHHPSVMVMMKALPGRRCQWIGVTGFFSRVSAVGPLTDGLQQAAGSGCSAFTGSAIKTEPNWTDAGTGTVHALVGSKSDFHNIWRSAYPAPGRRVFLK